MSRIRELLADDAHGDLSPEDAGREFGWPAYDDPSGLRALHRRGLQRVFADGASRGAACAAAACVVGYCWLLLAPPHWVSIAAPLPANGPVWRIVGLLLTGGAWSAGTVLAVGLPAAALLRSVWTRTSDSKSPPATRAAQIGFAAVAVGVAGALACELQGRVSAGPLGLWVVAAALAVAAVALCVCELLLARTFGVGLLAVNASIAIVTTIRELGQPALWALLAVLYAVTLVWVRRPAIAVSLIVPRGFESVARRVSLHADAGPLHSFIVQGVLIATLLLAIASSLTVDPLDGFGATWPGVLVGVVSLAFVIPLGLRIVRTVFTQAEGIVSQLAGMDASLGLREPEARIRDSLRQLLSRRQYLALLGLPLWLCAGAAILLAFPAQRADAMGPLALILATTAVVSELQAVRTHIRERVLWSALREFVAAPFVPSDPLGPGLTGISAVVGDAISLARPHGGGSRALIARLDEAVASEDMGRIVGILAEVLFGLVRSQGLGPAIVRRVLTYAVALALAFAVAAVAVAEFLGPDRLHAVVEDQLAQLALFSMPLAVAAWALRSGISKISEIVRSVRDH